MADHPYILLLEDEDLVREFFTGALDGFGYRVRTFENGEQLLALPNLKEELSLSSLVATDGDMPHNDRTPSMHGTELALALRIQHDYTKPVILSTGREPQNYQRLLTETVEIAGRKVPILTDILAKPVSLATLKAAFGKALKNQ